MLLFRICPAALRTTMPLPRESKTLLFWRTGSAPSKISMLGPTFPWTRLPSTQPRVPRRNTMPDCWLLWMVHCRIVGTPCDSTTTQGIGPADTSHLSMTGAPFETAMQGKAAFSCTHFSPVRVIEARMSHTGARASFLSTVFSGSEPRMVTSGLLTTMCSSYSPMRTTMVSPERQACSAFLMDVNSPQPFLSTTIILPMNSRSKI
mmetsp:Transcript_86078/g.143627  ORF Transcript_86078/g.143627 Transcript_86078/m.143627 type:complete len:205 (+) Transcript_86078:224-838(+)